MSAWCSRSVHVIHVVADQEHSDCAVPRYRYRTELVEICNTKQTRLYGTYSHIISQSSGRNHAKCLWLLVITMSESSPWLYT